MKYKAEINVMPLSELLDPQGKAVSSGLKNLGMSGVIDVRIGKRITVELEAASDELAKEEIETACKKLLSNPVMESFEYSFTAIKKEKSKK
jgi:phosphoribosylformylglycinamidine synthase PurS subunit